MQPPVSPAPSPANGPEPEWIEVVRAHVRSLHYGIVQIVVHDSEVTQIEKTERLRLKRNRVSTP